MTIKATARPSIKRSYPHVTEIQDWPAAQSVKLLWERIHDLEERLQAAEGTNTTLVTSANQLTTSVQSAQQVADQALAIGRTTSVGSSDTGGAGGDSTPLPGGGDGGDGDVGCAAAGPTGHDTGGLLNAVRAGQIVCGTGNEFAELKNPVVDLAAREAAGETLILRMIWHLKEAGFTAGRQKNPSGAISNDKLCVVVDSVTRAYDVFIGFHEFDVAMTTHMAETAPANLVDDAGISD